ncbi:hypothetical protein QQS21_007057 [Conoideocrella luteorostrata]|uniref:Uncharacterized protein n=1 Tax=Conoideocrella luteorostrata TaxID=1105319 RepID=A0AAJ0CP48_9HYPO|nr:hypothetical protein QQS21_007057 [Conoideocrella luteorostrata]
MQLTKFVLAILPALALADTSSASASASSAPATTTTCTSTMKLVKTVTLSQAHTVTSTLAQNTTSFMPTGGMTSVSTPPVVTTAPAPVPVPSTKGPDNAAGTLDATRVALAGVAGMIVVAMM